MVAPAPLAAAPTLRPVVTRAVFGAGTTRLVLRPTVMQPLLRIEQRTITLRVGIPQNAGSSGGAVDSVNGKTGAVTLTAADVAADASGTAAAARTAHEAAPDPHPQYTTPAEAAAAAPVQSVNGKTGTAVLSAADVGADASGTAAAAMAAHLAASDPHPQYAGGGLTYAQAARLQAVLG